MTTNKLLILLASVVLVLFAAAWHYTIYTIDDNDIIKILREDIEELRNREFFLVIRNYEGKIIYEYVAEHRSVEFYKPILVKSFEIR